MTRVSAKAKRKNCGWSDGALEKRFDMGIEVEEFCGSSLVFFWWLTRFLFFFFFFFFVSFIPFFGLDICQFDFCFLRCCRSISGRYCDSDLSHFRGFEGIIVIA